MIINIVIEILVSKLDVYNSFDQHARCVTLPLRFLCHNVIREMLVSFEQKGDVISSQKTIVFTDKFGSYDQLLFLRSFAYDVPLVNFF